MNTDIRLQVNFFDHPKTVKLQRKLGPEGVIALLKLWTWAATDRPNGDLSGMDAEDIAIAAGWQGDEDILLDALCSIGWLNCPTDESPDFVINDWAEYNPWAADAERRSDKARLSWMHSKHPEIGAHLRLEGVTALTLKEKNLILANEMDFLNGDLDIKFKYKSATSPATSTAHSKLGAGESPATRPAPSPSPSPSPSPAPTLQEEPSVLCCPEQGQDNAAPVKATKTAANVVKLWNDTLAKHNCTAILPLKRVAKGGSRMKLINARLKEYPWEDFVTCFENVATSDYLNGRKPGNFPSWFKFDWLIRPNNFLKALEGEYNKGDSPAIMAGVGGDGHTPGQKNQTLRERLAAKGMLDQSAGAASNG